MKNLLKNRLFFRLSHEILSVLKGKRKLQLIIVICFMVLSGLSEMLTIGALYPYINLINNPKSGFQEESLQTIIKVFKISTPEQLIYTSTFLFILIVIFTSITRLLNLTLNYRLSAYIGNELAISAYKNILYKNYIYHKNVNSSELISALTTKITLTIRMIRSFLQLATSSIVLIFIVVCTLLINKNITIIIGISISIIYFFISTFTRKKLHKNSQAIASKNNEVVKIIQEGFGSIREILLYRFQKVYVSSFGKSDLKLRLSTANSDIISSFPKFILEGMSIIILCLIGLIVFSQNRENGSTIPLLATFALASQKLLPAAQLVYSSFSDIIGKSKSAFDVLEIIGEKKYNLNILENYPRTLFREIEFLNVYFRYEKNQPYVIEDFSVKIKSGESLALIGETGSGKTTFIDLLMGLLKPTKGKILVNGQDINSSEKKIVSWRDCIAHVPQNIFLLDSSIKENIIFGEKQKNYERMKLAIRTSKLESFIRNLRNGLLTNIGERGTKLSGGQQQRIGLARAFYKNKPLMIFDEATSALDEKTESQIFSEINRFKTNKTLFMITHRLSTLKNVDRVLLLKNGRLFLDKSSSSINLEQDLYNTKYK